MSVFKHLEVNVFPSVPYNLDINIRRDEAAALQQYFKLEVRRRLSSLPFNLRNEPPPQPQPLSTALRIFKRRTKQEEADEPRSKGRRLLSSRKNPPKAASNSSSTTRGGGERGDAPPDSLNTACDPSGVGVGVSVPGPLEHQGSEEGRALLLGRRPAGSAPPNPTGGVVSAAAAGVAGMEAAKKVVRLVVVAVATVFVVVSPFSTIPASKNRTLWLFYLCLLLVR